MNTRAATCFGLIRHAPTLWNEQKRIQGQQDSPLSERGRAMAESWGPQLAAFAWDRLICSDLERGARTASLVNRSLHLPVIFDPGLREQDWGAWTGMTLKEINSEVNSQVSNQEQRGWDFRPPEGESRREVLARSRAVLADAHAGWPGEKILLICHEGVIKCLLYHLLGRQFMPEEPKVILNFHLHLMAMEEGMLSLRKMNALALTTVKESG